MFIFARTHTPVQDEIELSVRILISNEFKENVLHIRPFGSLSLFQNWRKYIDNGLSVCE